MLEFLLAATVPVAIYYALIFTWRRLRPKPPIKEEPSPRLVALPIGDGAWQAFNSPASKLPSHGTNWLAQRYAIDLVGYDPNAGYSRVQDWRGKYWLEPPDRFFGFGAAAIAPEAGTVVQAYDGMSDRFACRSWPGIFWFYISGFSLRLIAMAWRSPAGLASITGNHVILRLDDGVHLAFMHLRKGSVELKPGDAVTTGDVIGRVGNTGNTTQPHLHLQLMDGPDPHTAGPLPIEFASYELLDGLSWRPVEGSLPENEQIIRTPAPFSQIANV